MHLTWQTAIWTEIKVMEGWDVKLQIKKVGFYWKAGQNEK